MAVRRALFQADLDGKKKELLKEIAPLGRGVKATSVEKNRVEKLCKDLERRNPTPKPLASSAVNGRWELRYTTSDSILGSKRPFFLRPQGPIYQTLDAPGGRAKNAETWPFFNQVTADLKPLNESCVKVKFDMFKILGLIPVKCPPRFVGTLDTTYLDTEMRISRGDKGNLFVLTMDKPGAKP